MPKKESLRHRAIRAGAWTAFGSLAAQGIRFGGNLIMAKLLMPEAFGIMAIAWATMAGLGMMSDAGIRQYVVQNSSGEDQNLLNTAWSLQIIRGAAITGVALVIAFAFEFAQGFSVFTLGTVYSHEDLPKILAVVAFTALIGGFETMKVATANRNLAFKRVVAIDLGSQLVGFSVMLIWAQLNRTVWALVFGGLVSVFVRVALGHHLLPGQINKWHLDEVITKNILRFGGWIFLSSLLEFASANGDRIVLGGVLPTNEMGQYALAVLMIGAVQLLFFRAANVTLPVLSEINRERPHQLKEMLYRLRLPIDLAALFLAGVLFSTGVWITGLLYDARYQLVGSIVQVLALLLIESRYEVAVQCYLAIGKPKLIVPVKIIRALLLYIPLPFVAQHFGVIGASWAVVAATLAGIPAHILLLHKLRLLSAKREIFVLPITLFGWATGELFLSLVS